MGKHATQLLEAFEALPANDKQALAVEVLRRTREVPFDSDPLTDWLFDLGMTAKTRPVLVGQRQLAWYPALAARG